MKYLRILAVFGMVLFAASFAHAQRVVVGVGFGAPAPVVVGPPACYYGYYPYAPYACAPYGYYGPEWFDGGVFIGAGPWFHGYPGFWADRDFHDRGWLYFRGHRRDFDDRRWHEGNQHRGDFDRGRNFDQHRGFRGGEGFHHDNGFHGGNNFHGDAHGNRSFRGEGHGGGGFHGGGRR